MISKVIKNKRLIRSKKMEKLSNYTNEEIGQLVLFETKEQAEQILKERFPNEKINVKVFSNNDAFITINDRRISISKGKIN